MTKVNGSVVILPVRKPGFVSVRAVVRVDDEPLNTRREEVIKSEGDKGLIRDWDQRLWQRNGKWSQSRAEPGAEDKSGADQRLQSEREVKKY